MTIHTAGFIAVHVLTNHREKLRESEPAAGDAALLFSPGTFKKGPAHWTASRFDYCTLSSSFQKISVKIWIGGTDYDLFKPPAQKFFPA